ncbi:hypothetical protein BG844_28530 [Couchioplanes caeruleus subsp. caeruleus]|uniref:Uncharacterized protein n=1 Tax=Couchioplanes caeruleus subsp. caeruleus TaxID=56427 RepID=A0A1K0GPD7_9ACTN|nr:hypothetical protein BG844_28530 [Couchioplanes caeruleus subsp. caeruleus]
MAVGCLVAIGRAEVGPCTQVSHGVAETCLFVCMVDEDPGHEKSSDLYALRGCALVELSEPGGGSGAVRGSPLAAVSSRAVFWRRLSLSSVI